MHKYYFYKQIGFLQKGQKFVVITVSFYCQKTVSTQIVQHKKGYNTFFKSLFDIIFSLQKGNFSKSVRPKYNFTVMLCTYITYISLFQLYSTEHIFSLTSKLALLITVLPINVSIHFWLKYRPRNAGQFSGFNLTFFPLIFPNIVPRPWSVHQFIYALTTWTTISNPNVGD